jgi:hypothetical protein
MRDDVIRKQLLYRLNHATAEALELMRQGRLPKLERVPTLHTYPNGCPIISEGPQRDDL